MDRYFRKFLFSIAIGMCVLLVAQEDTESISQVLPDDGTHVVQFWQVVPSTFDGGLRRHTYFKRYGLHDASDFMIKSAGLCCAPSGAGLFACGKYARGADELLMGRRVPYFLRAHVPDEHKCMVWCRNAAVPQDQLGHETMQRALAALSNTVHVYSKSDCPACTKIADIAQIVAQEDGRLRFDQVCTQSSDRRSLVRGQDEFIGFDEGRVMSSKEILSSEGEYGPEDDEVIVSRTFSGGTLGAAEQLCDLHRKRIEYDAQDLGGKDVKIHADCIERLDEQGASVYVLTYDAYTDDID